jgi:hypothetical protein
MARLWMILGGVLALISLLFTWWFSYYTTSSFHSLNPMISLFGNSSRLIDNISPIEFAGSPGVQIIYTTFGINYSKSSFLIPIAIILIIVAGFLGIVLGILSPKPTLYDKVAGAMVLAAVVAFVLVLVYTGGLSLIAGTMNVFGITAVWSSGPGLFIALIGGLVMIFPIKLNRKEGRTKKS